MIYLETKEGTTLIVVEPGNLERLKRGEGIVAGAGGGRAGIRIAYTPDMPWLMEKIGEAVRRGDMGGTMINTLIAESLSREPVTDREYHPPQELFRDGKIVMEDS